MSLIKYVCGARGSNDGEDVAGGACWEVRHITRHTLSVSHADNIANGFDNIKLQIQIKTKMHIWGRVKFMMDSSEDPST